MSTYLDIHDVPGIKAGDVVAAHEADLRVGKIYGVDYRHYWVDEEAGKVFCLVDAPDRETAIRVHRISEREWPSPTSLSAAPPPGHSRSDR